MITFLNKYKAYILGVYAFLLLIHFFLKDYIFPLSILFYATPIILIILYGIFTAVVFQKNKKHFYSLIVVLCFLTFHFFSKAYYLPKIRTNDVKNNSVLFWNIAKNKSGFPLDIISKKIEEFPINILTFVEADNISSEEFEVIRKKFKLYSFQKLKGNMIVGVKGSIKSVNYQTKKKRFKYNYITAVVNDKTIKLLIADVYASLFYSKAETLKTIIDFSETHEVDFILGDFNTPYESIHFNNYKNNYTSLRDYSDGFTATWPFGIPLLELDQIWVGKSIYASRLNKYNYSFSDHQLLIAEYLKLN
ncbi:endonuclease/exonuclease/phosphatase family protein [Lacinutrix sp. Bg11-31]|uniref:endonuclease/exonuclease/phosphatase family protein n=1 Tax=Lacinutrix sp. Bg11-31 TaxID=2057808 RepID=UPI000C308B53|nr:endonuclease/exonuclease/phosphatase family protein [Lacinutrix sp. Bg11-31]AUC83595.1 hypothetical protein CW733_16255 [Lacinutrix sp. Bg11-31]